MQRVCLTAFIGYLKTRVQAAAAAATAAATAVEVSFFSLLEAASRMSARSPFTQCLTIQVCFWTSSKGNRFSGSRTSNYKPVSIPYTSWIDIEAILPS